MVLAPHPDDETLGAGIVLQQAQAAGAQVRVVFATAGEANPWPQRWIERRWRVDASDRQRWGERRSEEARQALRRLGVEADAAVFLGWPDGAIENLLITDSDRASAQIAALIAAFRPTRIVLPCIRDRHPDHSALNLLTRAALLGLGKCSPLLLEYLVHAHGAARAALEYRQAPGEVVQLAAAKLAALEAHQTQLRLNRGWLLRRAREAEAFAPATTAARGNPDRVQTKSAITLLSSGPDGTRLQLDNRHPAAGRSRFGLLLAGVSPGHVDVWRCASVRNPDHSGTADIALTDCANGALLGDADYRRAGVHAWLTLPRTLPGQLLYARFARPRRWLQVVERDSWVGL